MRKHISVKVYSMLTVLLAIFLVYAYFASRGILNAKDAVTQISDVYMELLVQPTFSYIFCNNFILYQQSHIDV